MGKLYESITDELAAWIEAQHLFFVATAPASEHGHINCSPKGMDTFRILGPSTVGYLDLTGSGAETIAHLRENGRIVFMFCAFDGPPNIVRLHGRGEVLTPAHPEWQDAAATFGEREGTRSVIRATITRISDSCGYAVPKYEFVSERDGLERWARSKGAEGLPVYRAANNERSIDGLAAWAAEDEPR